MSYSAIAHSNPVHAIEEISLTRHPNHDTTQQNKKWDAVHDKIDPMLDNYTKYQEYMQEHPNMMNTYHPLEPSMREVIPLEELPVKKLLGRKLP